MTAESETILIEVRHRYTASPERVFDAWLDVDRARQWMFTTGPGTNVLAEIDPRPGGAFRFVDRRPDGDMEHVGEYLEIDRPRRLVFRFGVPSISPDLDLVTLDFAALPDGGCELTLRHEMNARWAEYADGSRKAWSGMLEGVERSLEEGGEWAVLLDPASLRYERLLPGPVERVWSYLVESDKRARWLAGGEMEPRVGGKVDLHFRHEDLSPEPGEVPARYRHLEDGFTSTERVTIWEPPRRLGLTWGDGAGGSSEAVFELTSAGDRVRLVLTHRQLPPGEVLIGTAGGWHTHLAILGDVLEGRTPPSFWRLHEGVEEEYGRRLAVGPS